MRHPLLRRHGRSANLHYPKLGDRAEFPATIYLRVTRAHPRAATAQEQGLLPVGHPPARRQRPAAPPTPPFPDRGEEEPLLWNSRSNRVPTCRALLRIG